MSEDTKQLLICTIGILVFLIVSIGALCWNVNLNHEFRMACIEQGHGLEKCLNE